MSTIIANIDSFLWGLPFVLFVLIVGAYYFIRSGAFPIRHLHHVMKNTAGSMRSKEASTKKEGTVSPFEAVAIAIGGTVGCGNIAGVATAIATGGPGAVFWMWIWAFFGMMIKCVEVTLGCYYRNKDENGNYFGGSTYTIEKGIKWDMGLKIGGPLALAFSIALLISWLGGSQAYTIAEALNQSFHWNMIVVTLAYSAFVFYITCKGVPRVAKFATKAVPFMCLAFIVGGLALIALNLSNVPHVFYMIFHDAFMGTKAQVGGFAGCAVSECMRYGIARSMNSNEAGQGSSPFIHGSADCEHPMRQGLWGAFEVFVDTIIVCSITALAVLCTGVWTTGTPGVTLTMMAYSANFGIWGKYFIGFMAFLFGITTTSGWYTYDCTNIRYLLRYHPIARDKLINAWKYLFPLPNIVIVTSIVLTGNGPDTFWAIVDISLVIPVFVNLLALLVMRNKFFEIFKDYKARYMGIGKVDPDFALFYEQKPEVAKIAAETNDKIRLAKEAAYAKRDARRNKA